MKIAQCCLKYTPSAHRHWLWLLSGLLWSVVGVLLCVMAAHWLTDIDWPQSLIAASAGFTLGGIIYRFGFSRIARKNILRILQLPNEVCLFAFQTWRSYMLILIMMALGLALRHSSLPKITLAMIYLAIGTALTFSSTLYYEKWM
ncbi:MAG: hypothetical protein RBS57_10320 [Desulforhabdus sp.]|nr:hypothetical protein [Desulforhabdus sp.]